MTEIKSFVAATAVAIVTACLAGSAFGADAPRWTGFYIGGNIGGGWGSRDADYAGNDPLAQNFLLPINQGIPPASFKTSGALGGIQLGYNRQFSGKWLVGVETDFNWSGLKGSGSSSAVFIGNVFGPSTQTGALDEHVKWFGTVRVRLGYLPTNNLLTYITGGFAYGKVERSGSYTTDEVGNFYSGTLGGVSINCIGPGVCFAGSSSEIAAGWALGGGFEYALSKNLSLKADYLYVNLDASALTESATNLAPGQTPSTFSVNFNRASFNVARLGLNYHF
jgi:outer membrane immunogenic protein